MMANKVRQERPLFFSLPSDETVSQRANQTNVILSHRRRICFFQPLTKARSFGYRLRMTLRHSLDGGDVRGGLHIAVWGLAWH
jgi:hypothetical protein